MPARLKQRWSGRVAVLAVAAMFQLADTQNNAPNRPTPNVQIEGLADYKTWPEPRKFKNPQAAKRTHTASPARMQG
jgi:hypothetical protein